jgi:hypothetical protein
LAVDASFELLGLRGVAHAAGLHRLAAKARGAGKLDVVGAAVADTTVDLDVVLVLLAVNAERRLISLDRVAEVAG